MLYGLRKLLSLFVHQETPTSLQRCLSCLEARTSQVSKAPRSHSFLSSGPSGRRQVPVGLPLVRSPHFCSCLARLLDAMYASGLDTVVSVYWRRPFVGCLATPIGSVSCPDTFQSVMRLAGSYLETTSQLKS